MTYFLHPHVIFFGNESNHSHQQEQFFPLIYFISIFGTPGKKRFFGGFRTQKILVTHLGVLARKAEKRRCVSALFERVKKRARSASPSLIG